jgi:putative ABC transport system permease protein
MTAIDLALLLCPREFRDGYRREFGAGHARDAFDVGKTGIALRWESLARDISLSVRSLRRGPLFTFVSLLTLALAISINAVVFGAIDATLLKPLPFVQPQRLVFLCPGESTCGQLDNGIIGAYMRESKTLAQVGAFQYYPVTLLGRGLPRAMNVYAVSPDMFDVLGVRPELGTFFDSNRWFGRVVLSDELWRSAYGANPRAVGRIVNLSGMHMRIVGIAPPRTYMPMPGRAPELATSLWASMPPYLFKQAQSGNDWAIARIKPGVSPAAASADAQRIAKDLVRRYPVQEKGLSVGAVALSSVYRARTREFLLLMLAAVFAVLLIACANVANLLLARCTARNAEFAVRNALGGARSRIVQQVIVEIALLCCAGGAAGLLLAWLEMRTLIALGTASLVPGIENATIDARVVAFTTAAVVVSTIAAGVLPALLSTARNLGDALKPASRSGEARGAKAFRFVLGAAQVALAFAVIAASGLLYRSFVSAANADTGMNTANVYWATVSFNGPRFGRQQARAAFIDRAIGRIEALPGVLSAAAARPNPYLPDGAEDFRFKMPGRAYAKGTEPFALLTQITPQYFQMLKVPIVTGRNFTANDNAQSPDVAIVDEHFAREYFSGRSAVGARILTPVPDFADPSKTDYRSARIVGVVRNIPVLGMLDAPRYYVPQAQLASHTAAFFVKTAEPDPHLRAQLAGVIATVDRREAIQDFDSLQHTIDAHTVASERLSAALSGIVAIIALVLALAGIYAVVGYSVERQRHEWGVRMAIGASRRSVIGGVLRAALQIAAAGVAAGIVIAAFCGRMLQNLLFNVSALDPVTFIAVGVLLFASVAIACAVPAIRAGSQPPSEALRYE